MAAAAVMRAFMPVLQFCSAPGRAVGPIGALLFIARDNAAKNLTDLLEMTECSCTVE